MPDCQQPLSLKKVSKLALQYYQGMKFKCSGCDSIYTYNEHGGHKSYCMLQALQCIFQCANGKTYKSREEHSDHVKQEC